MQDFLEKLRSIVVPPPGETHSLFQASAVVFSISTIYLYFAGYIFCYFYYFAGFGVTLESLDLSTQFYLMRAYTCLGSYAGACFLLAVLLIVFAYLRGLLRTSVTLVAMLVAFPVLFYLSSYRAQMEHDAVFCNPVNRIQFRFKGQSEKLPAIENMTPAAVGANQAKKDQPERASAAADTTAAISDTKPTKNKDAPGVATTGELMALGQSGQLSLLLETKDRIVVFRVTQCQVGPMWDPTWPEVYTLERSDVEFTNVMPKGQKR